MVNAIRRLVQTDASAYRALMLEAYALHPEAFTSTSEERAELPLRWWQDRVEAGADAAQAVFGFFGDAHLQGVVGLAFAHRAKTKHKARLFGTYVRGAHRGAGVGRALMREVLAYARARPGLRVIQLTVTEGEGPARQLYERCGFVPFGSEPLAIAAGSGWLTKVHMWCDLAPPGTT